MAKTKKVQFNFDERSLRSLEELSRKEMAGQEFAEVTFRDPETKETRVMLIPKLSRKECLRDCNSSTFS